MLYSSQTLQGLWLLHLLIDALDLDDGRVQAVEVQKHDKIVVQAGLSETVSRH